VEVCANSALENRGDVTFRDLKMVWLAKNEEKVKDRTLRPVGCGTQIQLPEIP
jgi:hypothetical protein